MNLYRKLPVGIQSFEKLRTDKYLYVDKTEHLFRLILTSSPYFLSRPRRFGKSLFLSTLAAYFLGKKDLFKGLYIEKAEEERARSEGSEPWTEYPVLYLDFNMGQYNEKEGVKQVLNYHLTDFEKIPPCGKCISHCQLDRQGEQMGKFRESADADNE